MILKRRSRDPPSRRQSPLPVDPEIMALSEEVELVILIGRTLSAPPPPYSLVCRLICSYTRWMNHVCCEDMPLDRVDDGTGARCLYARLMPSGSTSTSSPSQTRYISFVQATAFISPAGRLSTFGLEKSLWVRYSPNCRERAVLKMFQFSYCSSWYIHFFSTPLPVLKPVKNRYWPLWYIMWTFFGGPVSQLVHHLS